MPHSTPFEGYTTDIITDLTLDYLSRRDKDRPFFVQYHHGEVPSDWPQSMHYRYWQHLAHHYVGAHYGVRTKTHKLIYYYGEALGQPATIDESKPKEWELFDLVADPYEMNSVYGRTEYANIQASLTAELARLQGVVGDEPFAE